ncbi:MAG: glycine--tRNA ligase [Candidatus Micrarchaeota archaeon]|nr:glycine--tRNA ligase [Candidatus Micrarchaeota archaeon]
MNVEELMAYAKRRALFWPSAEIYGGVAGVYEYGHIGALLKKRFEEVWTAYFVESQDDYYMIDGSNILPEKPLVASGHAALFNDILINCSKCNTYYRADVLLNDMGIDVSDGATVDEIDKIVKEQAVKCPKCKGAMAHAKPFNMMFDLGIGPEKDEKGYLRPETAQSVYLNFSREFNALRKTLPMGLAIIGKAYRNEISPRQGLYRLRELIQAELQIFFDPDEWKPILGRLGSRKVNVLMYQQEQMESITIKEWMEKYKIPEFYAYHLALIDTFYTEVLQVPRDSFRFREKGGTEKAFYNKVHMDIEVNVTSWNGFKEVGGLHYRTDYDLTSHSKGSNKDLSVNINGKRIMPNVLELSFGVDRNVWMLIDQFYKKIEDRDVLQVPAYLAPFSAGLFALQKDEALQKMTESIYRKLRRHARIALDDSGSIGRRYARLDEIGTPFCITIDFESVDKSSPNHNTVTVRHRDSKKQERVKVDELEGFISDNTTFDINKFA